MSKSESPKIGVRNKTHFRIIVRIAILIIFFAFSFSIVQAIGSLRWEQSVTLAGEPAGINALTTAGRQIFAAGTSSGDGTTSSPRNAFIRSYNISNGSMLWEDTFGDEDFLIFIKDIAVSDQYVVVSGYVTDNFYDQDWIIRAYTTNGLFLWENRFDHLGRVDIHPQLAIDSNVVYVSGLGMDEDAYYDVVVRSHDLMTGALIWQDVFGVPENSDGPNDIVAGNGMAYVVGSGTMQFGPDTDNWIIRAYNGSTGQMIWQNEAGAGSASSALMVNNTLFVTGSIDNDWVIKAYDSQDGSLLWQDQYDLAVQRDYGSDITTDGQNIYVVGEVGTEENGWDWFVRAYSISDGSIYWQTQFDHAGLNDIATVADVQGRKLFVGGFVNTSVDSLDWQIREYDTSNGELRGIIELVDSPSFDGFAGMKISGLKLVFAADENYLNYLKVYSTQ